MAAVYIGFAQLGAVLSFENAVTTFWPPSGFYFVVLVCHRKRHWPLLIIGAVLGNIAFDLLHGRPLLMSIGFSAANTMEAVLGAGLVREATSARPSVETTRSFLVLAGLAGVVSPIAGALVGAGVLASFGSAVGFWQNWAVWWSGDALGVLVVAPVFLVFVRPRTDPLERTRREMAFEALGILALEALLLTQVFIYPRSLGLEHDYLLLLPLAWAAARLPPRQTTCVQFVTVCAVVASAKIARTMLGPTAPSAAESAELVQGFAAAAAFMTMMLMATISEHRLQSAKLRSLAARLSREETVGRARLAEQLRDTLAQTLVAAKLQLRLSESSEPGERTRQTAGALGLIDEAIRDSLTLARDVGSTILQELGLAAAVRALVDESEVVFGLSCEMDIQLAHPVDPAASRLVYVALKELLSDAELHSGAQSVRVRLRTEGDSVRLEVRDDGVAFDPRELPIAEEEDLGPARLRAEIENAGGTLVIGPGADEGTVATVVVPFMEDGS